MHSGGLAAVSGVRAVVCSSAWYRLPVIQWEYVMAKLRHIAIQVPDLEKAAAFYEGVFGLKRLKKVEAPIGDAISLSDGIDEPDAAAIPGRHQGQQGRPGLGRIASLRIHRRG